MLDRERAETGNEPSAPVMTLGSLLYCKELKPSLTAQKGTSQTGYETAAPVMVRSPSLVAHNTTTNTAKAQQRTTPSIGEKK